MMQTAEFVRQSIPDVILIHPVLRKDPRGHFLETYRKDLYKKNGIACTFVQDNLVHSVENVFRGLHFQKDPMAQAKLVTAVQGKILEIAVDIRPDSATYLKTVLVTLDGNKNEQLYIPEGFAHGYHVLSREAWVHYKVSKAYSPSHEAGIRWDDPELGLRKHIKDPLLSEKDRKLPLLKDVL